MIREGSSAGPVSETYARQGTCLEVLFGGVFFVALLWRIGVWLDPYDALAGTFWPGLGMAMFAIVSSALLIASAPVRWRAALSGRGAGVVVVVAVLVFIATGFGARERAIRHELGGLERLEVPLADYRVEHGQFPGRLVELRTGIETEWAATHETSQWLEYSRQGDAWQLAVKLFQPADAPPEFEYTYESFVLRSDGERPFELEFAEPFGRWWRGYFR